MDALCPRCHTPLSPQANFCQACGAPQLTVDTSEPGEDEESAAGAGPAVGSQIAWPAAVRTAALIAAPAGLLSSLLSFSTLWVMAGAAWTVAVYLRRTATRLSPSLGSRIGCVFGIFAAAVATLIDALNLLVSRYGLHHGAEIDSRLHSAMQAGIDRVLASNPDALHELPWFFHFWLSGYGQAALVLASALVSAGSMLGFSALGGALGARYFGARTAFQPRS